MVKSSKVTSVLLIAGAFLGLAYLAYPATPMVVSSVMSTVQNATTVHAHTYLFTSSYFQFTTTAGRPTAILALTQRTNTEYLLATTQISTLYTMPYSTMLLPAYALFGLTATDFVVLAVLVVVLIGALVAGISTRRKGARAREPEQSTTLTEPVTQRQHTVNYRSLTKFCRECGAKIPRDSLFCEECGVQLLALEVTDTHDASERASQQALSAKANAEQGEHAVPSVKTVEPEHIPVPMVGVLDVWIPIILLVGTLLTGFFAGLFSILVLVVAAVFVHYDSKKFQIGGSRAILTLLFAIVGLPLYSYDLYELRKSQMRVHAG